MMLESISRHEKLTSQHDSQQQESRSSRPTQSPGCTLAFLWFGYMSYSGRSNRVPLPLNYHELIVLARRVLAQTSSLKPGYKDEN